jgi:hypothetical protein
MPSYGESSVTNGEGLRQADIFNSACWRSKGPPRVCVSLVTPLISRVIRLADALAAFSAAEAGLVFARAVGRRAAVIVCPRIRPGRTPIVVKKEKKCLRHVVPNPERQRRCGSEEVAR